MKLLDIDFGGFRSFAQDTLFEIGTRKPGLYAVAGANGMGKSTLFEAVFWTLFGRTSRGLKAGAIKSWKNWAGSPAACTRWQGSAGVFSVVRAWQPNALLVSYEGAEPRPVEQVELERLLHTSPAAFLNSCYFAQFTPSFVDLSPPEQSAIFTDVLGLSVWERGSDTATERARELEEHLQNFTNERERARGKAEALLATDLTASEEEWQHDRLQAIKACRRSIAILEPAQLALVEKIKDAETKLVEYGALSKQANSLEGLIGVAGGQARELENQLRALNSKDYKKCPTCGAPVTNKHVKAEIVRTKKLHNTATGQLEKAKEDHTAIVKRLRKFENQLDKRDIATRELANNEADQISLTKQVKRLQREPNPFTAMREVADEKGEALALQLEQLDKDIDEITSEIGYNKYWVQGFKELRLSVIRESLDQLTVETNQCLFELGLPDWQIEFDIEHETKSGTVKKNFTVFITAPGAPDAVPWEAWSGGESQRLRLAVAMGFSNLICSRTGNAPNFEFWDEPSTWTDEVGIGDMLAVLADRAERYGKVIFLADHRALDFGGFAGTITVSKDDKGSHIHG